MVGHGGSSAGSYLADPTSPIPSHCASIVTTSTVRVKYIARPFCLQTDNMLENQRITDVLPQVLQGTQNKSSNPNPNVTASIRKAEVLEKCSWRFV